MTCREYEKELSRELKKLKIKSLLAGSEAERRAISDKIRAETGILEFLQSIVSTKEYKYEVRA